MKRSRAPRLALDRLALATGLALPRPSRGAPARRAQALSRLALAAAELARAIAARRRLRISLIAGLILVPLAVGGWRWLRSSSLVSVDRVHVTGVHGPDAAQLERALVAAGKRMTTLDVNQRALLAAAAPFHLVRSLSVSTSFPHGLSIRVVEQLPVAVLTVAGAQTAVAADGAVLGPALASSGLPTVTGAYEPAPGALVHDGSLRGELEVLGAVPHALAPFLARAFEGPRGLTVVMKDGLQAYFGDATTPHAKWIALALVLAENLSARITAVDVRTPERPAAQFAPGYAPASATQGSESGPAATGGSSESIATALAAGLAASAGYSSSAEAQGANAAKAAEALSPNHSTTTSEGGSTSGAAGARAGAGTQAGSESAGTTRSESGGESSGTTRSESGGGAPPTGPASGG